MNYAEKTLYRIEIYFIKIQKMTKSKNAPKIWLQNGTKNINSSSHMLLDHCYAFVLSL